MEEALVLFSSFAQVSPYDVAFDAPAAWERALILEELGRLGDAAREYRWLLDRWQGAGESFTGRLDQVRERLSAIDD